MTVVVRPRKNGAPSKAALTRWLSRMQAASAMEPVEWHDDGLTMRIVANGLETKNELNRREHWRITNARRKRQRERLDMALAMAPWGADQKGLPARVALVRLGPGVLDPLCNLPSALKMAEDSVCDFFGVDDKPGCPIAFRCDQRKRRVPGVEIVLEWEAK